MVNEHYVKEILESKVSPKYPKSPDEYLVVDPDDIPKRTPDYRFKISSDDPWFKEDFEKRYVRHPDIVEPESRTICRPDLNNYWMEKHEEIQKHKKVLQGVHKDEGKPRLDLIPPEVLFALGKTLGKGLEKYEERNWEKGIPWTKIYASLQRHLWKFWGGEETDPESGLPHLYHALSNIAFLVTYLERGIPREDIPFPKEKDEISTKRDSGS